jgi:hypothetical protein
MLQSPVVCPTDPTDVLPAARILKLGYQRCHISDELRRTLLLRTRVNEANENRRARLGGNRRAGPTICDGDPTLAGGTPLGVGPVSLASHTPSAEAWAERCTLGYTFRSKAQPKETAIMFALSRVVVCGLWMGGAMTYSVVRVGMQEREVPASRVDTFWIVLEGSGPPVPLKVALPCGREALALFSSEHEAEMFCSLRVGRTRTSEKPRWGRSSRCFTVLLWRPGTWRSTPCPGSWAAGSWD